MTSLESAMGYTFHNSALLKTALTHTSYANEAKGRPQNNERMEFLGDSILSFVVAEHLFAAGQLAEGELTRRRAALVCEGALAAYARQVDLGAHLKLGKGEEQSGGRQRPSILADAFEALIAAIYLDGGIEPARAFILPFVRRAAVQSGGDDYKTRLQEVIQQNPQEHLQYQVAGESGPDHDKTFTVKVYLNTNCIGTGTGHSKKLAEQQAARQALVLMGLEENGE